LEVAEVTGTLKNRRKIDMKRGKIILNLGLANYDPIKMMES
jgi:hypothetical protein